MYVPHIQRVIDPEGQTHIFEGKECISCPPEEEAPRFTSVIQTPTGIYGQGADGWDEAYLSLPQEDATV